MLLSRRPVIMRRRGNGAVTQSHVRKGSERSGEETEPSDTQRYTEQTANEEPDGFPKKQELWNQWHPLQGKRSIKLTYLRT